MSVLLLWGFIYFVAGLALSIYIIWDGEKNGGMFYFATSVFIGYGALLGSLLMVFIFVGILAGIIALVSSVGTIWISGYLYEAYTNWQIKRRYYRNG